MGIRSRENSKKDIKQRDNKLKNDDIGTNIDGKAVYSNFDSFNNISYKPIMVSFFLLIVGICFLLLGISLVLDTEYLNSLPSIILGVLCLIPGSYYSFVTVQVLRGISEYNIELIEIS
ncbi:hypothetical protein RS030_111963 [Cryptosporidium xiaoi]|uniref:Transmembrane protein 230 n=1 Tax=Cryptosporidium xiaoi TaxID=659607 RepID=A0AAV9Y319_9CRYT